MKKISCLKYLIFFFALFAISFEVKAACDVSTDNSCNLGTTKVNPGEQGTILGGGLVKSLDKCTSDDGYYQLSMVDGDIVAVYDSSRGLPQSNGSDTYSCAGIAYNSNGFVIEGTITYDKDNSIVELKHTFTQSDYYYDIRTALNAGYVESYNITEGEGLLSFYCYNYYCYAYSYNKQDAGTVKGTITYRHKTLTDYSITAKFEFTIEPDLIYVQVPSYCNTSGWKNYQGNIYYITKYSGTSFPSCPSKPTSEPHKTFAGYLSSNEKFPAPTATCDGAVANPSSYGASTYNVACYKTSQYFKLYPNDGTLSGSQFTKEGDYYVYVGDSLTLPSATPNDSKMLFKTWESNKGDANAGTTVTLDSSESFRTYVAKYKYDSSTVSLNKSLVLGVNETKDLNTSLGLNVDSSQSVMLSSSDSNKVAVSKGDGYYYVNGKAQADNVTVYFEYYNTMGEAVTAVIKVTVTGDTTEEYVAPTEAQPTDPVATYIMNNAENPVSSAEIGGLTTTSMSACDKGYKVYYYNSEKIFDFKGAKNNLVYYRADNKCDGKSYDAICIDPSKKNPPKSGKQYVPAEKLNYAQLDPTKGGYDAAMYYFAKALSDGADYGAIFFAARVATYYYGQGVITAPYASHGEAYSVFAQKIGADGSFPSSVDKMVFTSRGTQVRDSAEGYFKEALNYSSSVSGTGSEDGDLTIEEDSHKTYWDDNIYVYEQTGKVISNSGVAVLGLEESCVGPYYSCEVVNQTRNGNNLSYTIRVRVKIETGTPSPNVDLSLTKFKLNLSGAAGTEGAAFLLYPETDSSSYQRFVVFHPSSSDAYLYVRIADGECKFIDPALDGNCSSESDCGQINEDWWIFLHCCDLVTDTSSFAYEYLCAGEDCYSENFLNECEYPGDNAPIGVDVYSIREAENKAGVKQYKCIVAISKKCTKTNNNCSEEQKRAATDTKRDKSANKYSIKDYSDESNPYCRVSCKEDWNIGSSSFGNYTGVRAVEAGSYFMINKNLFIGTTRTCVTTKIDIKAYAQTIEDYANKLLEAWNKYNYYQAKWQQLNDKNYDCKDWNDQYHVFSKNHKHDCGCNEYSYDKDGNVTGCKTPCTYDCAAHDTLKNCKEYSITLTTPFDYYNYKDDGTRNESQKNGGPGEVNGKTYDGKFYWRSYNTDSGDHWTAGSCASPSENCDDLRANAMTETEGFINAYRSVAQSYIDKINKESEYFTKCQNFALNVSEGEFKASADNVKAAFGTGSSYTTEGGLRSYSVKTREIKSLYAPFVQYFYEETEFMDLILAEKKNYMIRYDKENDELLGTNYMEANNTRAAIPDAYDDLNRQMYLARNYYTTDSYKASDDGDDDESLYNPDPTGDGYVLLSDKGGASTFGQADDDSLGIKTFSLCIWSSGYGKDESANRCAKAMIYYYKDANYIKQTLSNSSYFKNWGDWFLNNVTDEKVHAENLQDTTKISNPDEWTLYGGHNVFPISMDTKANLYRYQYKFYNIGMYNDGSLGRVMGGEVNVPSGTKKENGHSEETILIQENYHNCLYEVYESICRCCGEEIVTYAYFIEGQTPPQYVDQTGALPGTSTNTVINEAQIGAFTNTISLSNFASSTQRVLGANWKAQTPFFLEGEIHAGSNGTDQGAYLIKGIEEKGDEIYDETPEYSYILNPSTISSIRSYNKSNSYVPNVTGSTSYVAAEGKNKGTGFRKVGSGDIGWLVSNEEANERLRFFHYHSKYLSDTLKSYETTKYKSKLLTNKSKVCYVSGSASELEVKVKSLVKNGPTDSDCKWVDFVTPEGIRLAFK